MRLEGRVPVECQVYQARLGLLEQLEHLVPPDKLEPLAARERLDHLMVDQEPLVPPGQLVLQEGPRVTAVPPGGREVRELLEQREFRGSPGLEPPETRGVLGPQGLLVPWAIWSPRLVLSQAPEWLRLDHLAHRREREGRDRPRDETSRNTEDITMRIAHRSEAQI